MSGDPSIYDDKAAKAFSLRSSEPPRDYDVSGWDGSQKYRLRPSWFGVVKLEQLWESRDGRREWRTVQWPMIVKVERVELGL